MITALPRGQERQVRSTRVELACETGCPNRGWTRSATLSKGICERGPQGLPRGASSTHHLTSGATNIGHTGGLSKQAASNSLAEIEEMRTVKRLGKCTTKLRD